MKPLTSIIPSFFAPSPPTMRFAVLAPLIIVAGLSLADARPNAKVHHSKQSGTKAVKGSRDVTTSCNGSPANCALSLMDGYVFPGTHNSASSILDPNADLAAVSILRPLYCTTECQDRSVAQQFQDGIRAFHFELCDAADAKKNAILFNLFQLKFANPVPAYSPDDPVICHGSDPVWAYGPLLSIVFQQLQTQLSQSENQVIRIVIEFRQGTATVLLDRAVALFTSIFCSGNSNCPEAIQFSELYNKNPTLGDLTANGANRILFANPALTYHPTDNTHYNVPWVLQDYIACNYDAGNSFSEHITHLQQQCSTNAAPYLCTYYGAADQIVYHEPVPWKLQGQIGFGVYTEICVGSYAQEMNALGGMITVVPGCRSNNINLGMIELDYYDYWNHVSSDPTDFAKWVNQLNYNTSVSASWGTNY